MAEDRTGVLWLGTTLGVWQHDRVGRDLFRPPGLDNAPGPVRNGRILDLEIDAAGRVWVNTWQAGAHRFDPLRSHWTSFRHDA